MIEGIVQEIMAEIKKVERAAMIEELLKEESPLTLSQVCERTCLAKHTCLTYLRYLIEENKVSPISSASGKVYYAINKATTVQDVGNMHIEIAKESIKAKDEYEELNEKYEKVNLNVNGIYVNIISMMSIFVAIFSLITVNANIVFELTTQNMPDVFWGIIKINVFVVVCILILLVGVRLIIINPMLAKKKKTKVADKDVE